MERLISFWNFIRRNKYWAALLIFLLIIGVLDANSLWSRYQRRVEIKNLKREIAKYQKQYDDEKAQLQLLESSREMVEKLAREKYLMKRANEDVFVFVEPNEQIKQVTSTQPTPAAAPSKPATEQNTDSTQSSEATPADTSAGVPASKPEVPQPAAPSPKPAQ